MALYAISDLHLALSTDKPMDIFGGHWINHDEKIKKNWTDKITEEDTSINCRRYFLVYEIRG